MATPDRDTTDDALSDEYRASVGSVMQARKRYEEVCEAQGPDSWSAQQAQEYLGREIEHRNQMREQYDARGPE